MSDVTCQGVRKVRNVRSRSRSCGRREKEKKKKSTETETATSDVMCQGVRKVRNVRSRSRSCGRCEKEKKTKSTETETATTETTDTETTDTTETTEKTETTETETAATETTDTETETTQTTETETETSKTTETTGTFQTETEKFHKKQAKIEKQLNINRQEQTAETFHGHTFHEEQKLIHANTAELRRNAMHMHHMGCIDTKEKMKNANTQQLQTNALHQMHQMGCINTKEKMKMSNPSHEYENENENENEIENENDIYPSGIPLSTQQYQNEKETFLTLPVYKEDKHNTMFVPVKIVPLLKTLKTAKKINNLLQDNGVKLVKMSEMERQCLIKDIFEARHDIDRQYSYNIRKFVHFQTNSQQIVDICNLPNFSNLNENSIAQLLLHNRRQKAITNSNLLQGLTEPTNLKDLENMISTSFSPEHTKAFIYSIICNTTYDTSENLLAEELDANAKGINLGEHIAAFQQIRNISNFIKKKLSWIRSFGNTEIAGIHDQLKLKKILDSIQQLRGGGGLKREGRTRGHKPGAAAGPSNSRPAQVPAVVGERQVALLHTSEQRAVKLINPNNNCYANAIINLLLSSPPIINFLWLCGLKPEVEQVQGDVVRVFRQLMLLGEQVMMI